MERITRKNQDLESILPLTISAQYGLIDQNEFFDKRIASKDVANYYLVKRGEFAYNKSTSSDAPWGAIKRLDRYENGVLSTLYIVFKVIDESNTNSNFLVTYYDTNRWHRGIQAIAAEGARNHGLLNIAPADFFETELTLPQDVDEQKFVGEYFQQLNHLITLHQRKCDQLKNFKKSMLEKMFPKNGEKYPQIRFEGFTDAWEQRKYGEMAEYKKGPFGSALKKDSFVPRSSLSVKVYEQQNAINKNWKLERYFITQSYAQELSAFETHEGDILVSCAGTIGEMYELPSDSESGIINQALMRVRVNEEIVTKKMYKLLFQNMIEGFSKEHSNGSAMKNIPPFADLKPMETLVPSDKEQILIGDYFEQLNNLITLHQRKLDKLKNIKKSMLEKMFV